MCSGCAWVSQYGVSVGAALRSVNEFRVIRQSRFKMFRDAALMPKVVCFVNGCFAFESVGEEDAAEPTERAFVFWVREVMMPIDSEAVRLSFFCPLDFLQPKIAGEAKMLANQALV